MTSSLVAIGSGPLVRRIGRSAKIVYGSREVIVGGSAPIVVQSMTNTDTADVIGTAIQIKELARAGSELVRITVNNPEAAAAVPAPASSQAANNKHRVMELPGKLRQRPS